MNRLTNLCSKIRVLLSQYDTKKGTISYSPYLQLVKPLIDISKRANLNEQAAKSATSSLVQLCEEEQHHFTYINNVRNQIKLELITEFNTRQSNNIENKLLTKIQAINVFKKLNYKVIPVCSDLFWVSNKGVSAIVKVANNASFNGIKDTSWNVKEVNKLSIIKQCIGAHAGIYITPGITCLSTKKPAKTSDIFVMSGWNTVQLFKEHPTDNFSVAV